MRKHKHIIEFLEQLRAEGRIKTNSTVSDRLTYHDPCNISRRGGVLEQPRTLLNMVATNFVEMTDNGAMNWCCGGGVSSNERANPLRAQAFGARKRQLDEIQVETMVTACSNCRHMLEDGLEDNEMEVELIGITELLAENLDTSAAPKTS